MREGFGESSGYGELGGFGRAVVDHLGGNLDGGFAGDEEDASPVLCFHGWEVGAAQAYSTEDVYFEELQPVSADVERHLFVGKWLDDLVLYFPAFYADVPTVPAPIIAISTISSGMFCVLCDN